MNRKHQGRSPGDLYDLLAPAYEILASPERIAKEVAALEPRLRAQGVEKILDAGCAIGSHSIELARHGFRVTGIDRSRAMIREARKRAAREGVKVRLQQLDLGDADTSRGAPFDGLICLGNTIAYADTDRLRTRVLRAFRKAVRPGGLVVLQLRDLTTVRRAGHVFPLRSLRRDGEEWILLRRQDPVPGGMRFQVDLLYRRSIDSEWQTRSTESVLKVMGPRVWHDSLKRAGFVDVRVARDLAGSERGRKGGADLVLFARGKPESGVR